MNEKKVWDKILGDPRRCKWYWNGICTLEYAGKIRHIDDFPFCEMKVCENYEELKTSESREDVE